MASANIQAMKLSLAAGLASGLGSAGLYLLLSGNRAAESLDSSRVEAAKAVSREADLKALVAADEQSVELIKDQLQKDLDQLGNTPKYLETTFDDDKLLFAREFMKSVNYISHKYQLLVHHVVKHQHENRRLAAIENDDDLAYAKAYYEYDIRRMKVATEVEDQIFDHFGIIEMQFEASNRHHNKEAAFLKEKQDMQKQLQTEMANQDAEAIKDLTIEAAKELQAKIQEFQTMLMGSMSETDPATGRRVIKLNDNRFELLLQKERDKFYMETGFTTQQVSKYFAENREAIQQQKAEEVQKLRDQLVAKMEAAQAAKPAEDGKAPASSTAAKDAEDDWEDEDQGKAKGAKAKPAGKTVSLE